MSAADWANVAVPAALTVATLWLANSIRRRARAERELTTIAKRFETYPKLWRATRAAAPMAEVVDDERLSTFERKRLYDTLTEWFFDDAGGMLMGEPTRTIYLRAKENLQLEHGKLWPDSVAKHVTDAEDQELARSQVARRQLSLLRSAMRADLGIIGKPYGSQLDPRDRDFLRASGARLWKRPWWNGDVRLWLKEFALGRRRDPPTTEPSTHRGWSRGRRRRTSLRPDR